MTQTTWIIAEIFAGIALLTILTALVTRWFGQPGRQRPEDIAKERYARGQLSRAEYQQIAADLGITVGHDDERPQPPAQRGSGIESPVSHAD